MPRDSSGNYTLPAGNPVVTGTPIDSTWANTTMNDMAAAMTESLSRIGNGGMLAPFLFEDGAVATPAITFNSQPSLGAYRAGVNDMRFVTTASDIFGFTDTLFTSYVDATFAGTVTFADTAHATGQVSTDAAAPVAINDLTRKDYVDNELATQTLPFTSITGVATPAQIPDLDAAKITSGVLDDAQIPVANNSGTPATGFGGFRYTISGSTLNLFTT